MTHSVIFDLDGTLIDSAADIHATANSVLGAHGLAPFTRTEVQGFVGRGAPVLVARMLEARAQPTEGPGFDAFLAAFLELYEGACTLTTVYPNAVAALEALAARGTRLGLCTNKPLAPTHAVLRHFGLDRFFPVVIGGDSLGVKKPDPAPLLAAQQQLGGGPLLFVGDSEVDAETATRAAAPFLLYTEGYRKTPVADLPHTASFSDFAALPGLVARLSA